MKLSLIGLACFVGTSIAACGDADEPAPPTDETRSEGASSSSGGSGASSSGGVQRGQSGGGSGVIDLADGGTKAPFDAACEQCGKPL